MSSRKIFHFDLEGKRVLGFDTGLSAQAFAQAKLARIVTQNGFIVLPGGGIEIWKPSGVTELRGDAGASMVIWGPAFEGTRLDLVLGETCGPAGEKGETALDCLRYWINARSALGERAPPPWPAGAFMGLAENGGRPAGTVFFPPEGLLMRCVQAEGDEAWREGAESFVHPDLEGRAAAAFSAGTMLYRIFAGRGAFSGSGDAVHQDMREGVFLPPRLAVPGLDDTAAALIEGALAPAGGGRKRRETAGRPAALFPGGFTDLLGPPGSKPPASFIRPLTEAEAAKIEEEKRQYLKKSRLSVNTRRFVARNTALIAGAAAACLVIFLVARSVITGRAGLPDTGGMEAVEVAETYYRAIGALDHQMMEACVISKAGKADIDMVTHFFVLSKVREAYEPGFSVIPAQEWIDAGAPPGPLQVFGVSDLRVTKISGDDNETRFSAAFTLWTPESADPGESSESAQAPVTRGRSYRDELTLIRRKGDWRIAEIKRTPLPAGTSPDSSRDPAFDQ